MMRTVLVLATALTLAEALPAAALELDLPGDVDRAAVRYACDGGVTLDVEFINVGNNSLALMTYKGETTLLASVITGSGARYDGAQYELWTEGDEATFTDMMSGNPDGTACHES